MAARLIYYCLPDHKVFNIHATRLAKTFVCLDIVCFLGQAGGGAVMQKSGESDEPENMWKLGHGIYIFGCVAQLCFLALFAVLMVAFRRKVNQEGGSAEGRRRAIFLEAVIYVILLLITVRYNPVSVLLQCLILHALGSSYVSFDRVRSRHRS
jgi:hypothetical protein